MTEMASTSPCSEININNYYIGKKIINNIERKQLVYIDSKLDDDFYSGYYGYLSTHEVTLSKDNIFNLTI